MKRILGLILLILAIAGSVNYVKRMSELGPVKPTGNSAYDAGQKAGRAAVPVVLGGMGLLGLVLLFSTSDSRPVRPSMPLRRPPVQSRPPQGGVEWARPRPWFKTNAGIVVLAIFGAIAGLILLFTVGGAVLTWANRHRGPSRRIGPTTTPARPRMPPNMPTSREPVSSGPYTAGASVEARWAGRWIPGQITSINPGGFTVMVQLQDPRFQHPVLLPTNQIRLK